MRTSRAVLALIAWAGAVSAAELRGIPQVERDWTSLPVGGGGQTRDIIVHPTDSNRVYAASDAGGVYRSVDAGVSWELVNEGMTAEVPELPVFSSAAVIFDPTDPETLYTCVGTIVKPGWLFRSDDAAASWQLMHEGFRMDVTSSFPEGHRAPRRCLTPDPHRSGSFYVSTYTDGLYRTDDDGRSFQSIGLRGVYVSDVEVHPTDPDRLLVAAWSDGVLPGGVWMSDDRGASWSPTLQGVDAKQIEVAPSRPTDVYLTTYWDGVYKSTDGGLSWASSNGVPGAELPTGEGEPIYASFPVPIPRELVYGDVVVHPTDADRVYVVARGDATVYRSTDAGASWSSIGDPEMVAVLSIAIDPSAPERMYVSDTFAVFRTIDGGGSWSRSTEGLENTFAETVVFDPVTPGTFYVGLLDVTLLRTRDRGRSFDPIGDAVRAIAEPWRVNVGFEIAVDPTSTPHTLYFASGHWNGALNGGGVYKSLDEGDSWQTAYAGLPTGRVRELAIDPSSPSVLYAALDGDGLFRTQDGGQSWQAINNGIHFPHALFERSIFLWHPQIAVDPLDGRWVYFIADVRSGGGNVDPTGTLYRSDDRGRRWVPANAGLDDEYPTDLLIDPVDPRWLYLGTEERGLYVSSDRAANWRRVGPIDFRVQSIAVDPNDPDRIFVAGSGFLFQSEDRGRSWVSIEGPAAIRMLRHIAIDPHQPDALFAATSGQGVFRIDVGP